MRIRLITRTESTSLPRANWARTTAGWVRNRITRLRKVLASASAVNVVAPRVNDKHVDERTGERPRFAPTILPA